MPYLSDAVKDISFLTPWNREPEMTEVVKQALARGQTVQVRHSSFSDPGRDWNELVISGRTVPGSRREGY